MRSSTSAGRRALSAATASRTPRPVSTMLASCALLDVEGDRRPAVDARDRVLLLLAVDDVGDLGEVDRAAALLRDDDAAELRRVLDLAFDAHDRVVLAARDAAGRHVLVGVLHGGHHLVDADAERRRAPTA